MPNYSQTWDLDSLFLGGIQSSEFQQYLNNLQQDFNVFHQHIKIQSLNNKEFTEDLYNLLTSFQELVGHLGIAQAYIMCLNVQHTQNTQLQMLNETLSQLITSYFSSTSSLDNLLEQISEENWNLMLDNECFKTISFSLQKRRSIGKKKMAPELERLNRALAPNGYYAWEQLYHTLVNRIRIPFTDEKGQTVQLSVGQANSLTMSPVLHTRHNIFEKLSEAWSNDEKLFSMALNHLAGYRISLYQHYNYESTLTDALFNINHMSETTLYTMWETVRHNQEKLVRYLELKAQFMGVDKLSWTDLYAPLKESNEILEYEKAVTIICESMRNYDKNLADFVEEAFSKGWIETEKRSGKRTSASCINFAALGQSRIHLTYSGKINEIITLAHELGHAYHFHILKDLPILAHDCSLSLAETASTFCEQIITDALIQSAPTLDQQIALLDLKLQNTVVFLLDIYSRFLFETRFYKLRNNGIVGAEHLNQLMLQAQQEAFCNQLEGYHPYAWASQQHYYKTGVPFYNFPYAFGCLFSNCLYSQSKIDYSSFSKQFTDLLHDTGQMTVEDIARVHLGFNLQSPDFWQKSIDLMLEDIDLFEQLILKKSLC